MKITASSGTVRFTLEGDEVDSSAILEEAAERGLVPGGAQPMGFRVSFTVADMSIGELDWSVEL